ncbi:signal peptide peptidase SppA, 36K type [Candidatus Thiomargarita nelsonii]|uniref:Signal peptide peptidase SppA, 36K type n=1 Tax=Candidatus Thiomargarita nelsonii TaxID=1003181 RepID=A0A176RTP5_9GAMM|nr:signal peptide peptidase SppA, 36K type [Candidatus Thiomargarita nelsonii]
MSETKLDENWERDILRDLAFATITEQRRARRWRIFFILLFFIYLFVTLLIFVEPDWLSGDEDAGKKHTALVEVQGIIAADTQASADKIVTSLRRAFKDEKTAGVIIRINSPGGSPVQAGYINDEIKRLREKYPNIPVYAVATDMCTSGGYYIAAAADEIYADKATIIGSIGVLMDGFGFVGAMEKLGVERRLLTAGENKGFLDPFSPMKEEDLAHIKNVLKDVHDQFVTVVKQGREKSLTEKGKLELLDNPELFSGLLWTGEQAMELGLVDALGSSSYIAREIIKAEKIKDFTSKQNYLDRFAERLGATMAKTLAQQLKLNSATLQ